MIEYYVSPSKIMFKVIPMHTKPLKHARYNEILRNTLKKERLNQK